MVNQYNFYNLEASFKEYLIAGNKKPVSIKNYLSDLRHFLGWTIIKISAISESVFDGKNQKLKVDDNNLNFLNLINEELIAEYKTYLYENKIPFKTINRRLSTLRRFFSFCISQGWLKENPAKKISNISNLNKEESKNLNENVDLNQFYKDLLQENLDQKTITSYLEDIREFLSFQ